MRKVVKGSFSKPIKQKKSRDFKFNLNYDTLKKSSKDIIDLEQVIYEHIRINTTSTKRMHRGIYDDLISLDYLLSFELVNYKLDWYIESKVFSYIHDVCSINTPPDYNKRKLSKVTDTSIDKLCNMLIDYSKSIGVKRISIKKHRGVCEWFIVYLSRLKRCGGFGMKYTRDKTFNTNHKVLNKNFSYPVVIRLVDMLVKENLVIPFNGNVLYGTRSSSLLVVNPEMYDLFGIECEVEVTTTPKSVVKVTDDDGKEIAYEDLEEEVMYLVEEGVEIFDKYHSVMRRSKVDINGYLIPEIWLHRILKVMKETCGRVFDDGSVQGKSKLVRSMLVIDGEPTVSLDFKSIHPSILLCWEGVSLKEHDPYPKLESIQIDKDLVKRFVDFYDLDKYDPVRNIVKKLVLCLINATSVEAAVGSCYEDLRKDNMKKGTYHEHTMKYIGLPKVNLHDVAKEIMKYNEVISKYFGIGIGNKLQWKDSSIIMYCLDKLSDLDVPCIPIHDALICKGVDKRLVEDVMTKGFLQTVGSLENCIIEEE